MKKVNFLLILMLSLLICKGQSLLQEGKLWSNTTIGTMPGGTYSSYFIKFMGDTILNELGYKKIMKSNDALHSKWTLNGCIREEPATGKVYIFNGPNGKDRLIYDFSLEIGDSILTGDGVSYAKVTKVINATFGSSTVIRKQIYFFDPNGNTKWIEGIGSTWGILEGLNSFYTTGADPKLVCYSENDQEIYHNPLFMNCFPEGFNSNADYQTVYANRVALFDNAEHRIIGIRATSVKDGSNTILYPFATIQEVSAYCFSPYLASWIGEKVVLKPDGTNLFYNRDNGVVTLKTQARLNQSWIAFQRADTFIVEGSVESVELENVLGLSDSVKTIAFRVLDQKGNTINHALNQLKVKISKRYGFVETLNFYLFPNIVVGYPYDRLEKYTLIGLTDPKVGVQNLTWFDVNSFNPGDELHVQEHKLGDGYLLSPIREYDNRCIYKYLKRTDYADSIVYRYARQQSIKSIYADSTTLKTYNDTLKSVILAKPVFDKLPGEPIIEANVAYQMYMRSDKFLMKIDPSMTEFYIDNRDNGSCLGIIIGEGCLYEKRYIKGLGGPYYSCSGIAGDSEERKLVYFKKGETEWGKRLVITDVSNLKTDTPLHLFPNPAHDMVTFQLNDDAGTHEVKIYSQTGTILKSKQFKGASCNINLKGLKSGIYLYKITSSPLLIYTGKLVVD